MYVFLNELVFSHVAANIMDIFMVMNTAGTLYFANKDALKVIVYYSIYYISSYTDHMRNILCQLTAFPPPLSSSSPLLPL